MPLHLVPVKILPSQVDIILQFDHYIYYIFVSLITYIAFQGRYICQSYLIYNYVILITNTPFLGGYRINSIIVMSALFGCH